MTENERIKEIRKEHNLTVEKFGQKVGVGKSAISNIENGVRGITPQMRLSICREFNVNEEWLKDGIGEKYCLPTDEYTEVVTRLGQSDPRACELIMIYNSLTQEDKELFWKFFERFISSSIKQD